LKESCSIIEPEYSAQTYTTPDFMALSMTGGNFRLLTRLLIQIERVLSVNDLHLISTAVVEAARDSLVIGPG
jgi:hypothetical protein